MGKQTSFRPILSVIIFVISKSEVSVPFSFVNHSYDQRPYWTLTQSICIINCGRMVVGNVTMSVAGF